MQRHTDELQLLHALSLALLATDSGGVVTARLARQVPGARVIRSARGDMVCATVSVRPRGPVALLGLRASASACALTGGR